MADHYAGEEIMANFWLFFRILLAIFVIYLIFEIIRKILGGSWGVQELIAALLVANLGYSFQTNHRISSMIQSFPAILAGTREEKATLNKRHSVNIP